MTAHEQAILWVMEHRQTHREWAAWQEANPNWRAEVKPDSPGGPEHHRECERRYDLVLSVLESGRALLERLDTARGEYSREQTQQAVGELRGVAENLRRGKNDLTAAQLDHVLDLALACSE